MLFCGILNAFEPYKYYTAKSKRMNMNTISPREYEVLDQTSWRMTTREIAQMLYLSRHTVESHRKNLLLKMDAKKTAGLVRRAFESGILELQSNPT
ncbi:MAG: DNA-binding CsgD family transcriptional regulator [Saprospiraceae bacterium]|jgi:DNA-binding CsgD family transcriptional regulator